jgi:hypothetical protein
VDPSWLSWLVVLQSNVDFDCFRASLFLLLGRVGSIRTRESTDANEENQGNTLVDLLATVAARCESSL